MQECHDVDTSIPTTQFNFMPIDKIANIETNTMIGLLYDITKKFNLNWEIFRRNWCL